MTFNKVKEDNYYFFIRSPQFSEDLKEESNKEQKIEVKFEKFDFPFIKCFWPTI